MSTMIRAAEAPLETPFQVHSITLTATPPGSEGTWYRYVIAQGSNMITGQRAGTESEVELAVREMVDRLNERNAGKSKGYRSKK